MLIISQIASIAFLVLVTISVVAAGDHGGHKSVEVGIPYKIHTVHHHHVEKFPVYKKVEVPVIKEIKVPYPVHVPIKVPYPVVVKPHIVTVPVHHYPVHTSEHQHEHHDGGHGDEGNHGDQGESYGHQGEGYGHSGW